jgi:SAM-dependent methyltransferase
MPEIRFRLPPQGSLTPSSNTDPIDYYYKPIVGRLFVARINTVLGLVTPGNYETILEIGYGSGLLLPSLVRHADRYVGIDIAPPSESLRSLIKKLDLHPDKVALVHGDISAVEMRPVDLAVAVSVLEHVKDLDGILSAIRAKLKPGGLLLVGMPRVDKAMTWLIENGLGFEGIDDHHVSTFQMFLDAARKDFRVLKTARMPAWLPRFAAIYHAALLRTA